VSVCKEGGGGQAEGDAVRKIAWRWEGGKVRSGVQKQLSSVGGADYERLSALQQGKVSEKMTG